MRCPAIPETPVLKAVVAAACQYEVVAIGSGGRLPTISAHVKRWPLLGVAVLIGLGIHFYAVAPDLLDIIQED